jgi:hydroxymethylglutaryl-CoA reductase (NADPH)
MPIPFRRRDRAPGRTQPAFEPGRAIPGPRDWSPAAWEERTAFVEELAGPIPELTGRTASPAPDFFQGNIENYIGLTLVPTGIVGPLRMRGEYAQGDYYLPLATTEGALVASYNRGVRVTTMAGGIVSLIGGQSVHRAPLFAFADMPDAVRFASWLEGQEGAFRGVTARCTRHGELTNVRIHLEANLVYIIFSYRTGDAAGQNMVTFCTDAICKYVLEHTPIQPEHWFLESNLSGDKKATFYSFLSGRGWTATAEVILPEDLVRRKLRTTPRQMQTFWETGTVAAIQAGSIGASGHIANGLTALFLACGQDVACISEASVGVTRFEVTNKGDLRCTITLPNLIVGTVGGGTRMPTAREALRIAGCEGAGGAPRLAELCAGLSLAGEISISAALCAGDFAAAHAAYGRASSSTEASPPLGEAAAPSTTSLPARRIRAVPVGSGGVATRASFDQIRYATVWEDADVVCEALAPRAKGGRVLSVASAGDNVLALLSLDPAEVVAVDLSAAQLACLELRMAAFRELEHDALLSFLGFKPHPDRLDVYARRIRQHLSASARAAWDARARSIRRGAALAGRFEQYLRIFGRWVVPLVHSRRKIRALLESRTKEEREAFYEREWNTLRWRLLTKIFFSRSVMGRYGRDPAFFDQVDVSVGEELCQRNERFLRSSRVDRNPYLTLLLTGGFEGTELPRYLRAELHDVIRSRLSRVQLVHGGLAQARNGAFDAFNLSDIFEYMRPDEHRAAVDRLLDMAAPRARIAYWELFVPRPLGGAGSDRVTECREESERLTAAAKTWFYRGVRVWEVTGDGGSA